MHTIKFRGKSLSTGEWVYGYYANILGDHLIIDNSGIQYIVDPNTVGQYTGMQDKNRKHIYENDIVKTESEEIVHVVYQMAWRLKDIKHVEEAGAIASMGFHIHTQVCLGTQIYGQVIGDIHDNPDLLTH